MKDTFLSTNDDLFQEMCERLQETALDKDQMLLYANINFHIKKKNSIHLCLLYDSHSNVYICSDVQKRKKMRVKLVITEINADQKNFRHFISPILDKIPALKVI